MKLVKNQNKQFETNSENKKFLFLIGIVLIAIIVVVIMLLLVRQQTKKANSFGIFVDGKKIESMSIDNIVNEDGELYFPIKDIATNLGYQAYNGEYLVQTEAIDKCHIVNSLESASFFENEKYVYKMATNTTAKNYKEQAINQPVKRINDKLYVSAEGLSIACNVAIKVGADKQKIEIYTLSYLIKQYQEAANKNNYMVDTEIFENQKAMLKGWAVVTDENGKYGIIDTAGSPILGIKYGKIEYNEYANIFNITDMNNNVGIWKIEDNKGIPQISNSYEEVYLMDKEKQLYIVSYNGKYGVVDINEKSVIPIEYDSIGISSDKFDVKNRYIMYNNLIPVNKNGKWGVYNLNGEIVIPFEYDELGCSSTTENSAVGAVLIPEYGLIVLKKGESYGLINWKGEEVIVFALSEVGYSKVSGEQRAYMISNGEKYDVVTHLDNDGTKQRYEIDNEEDIFSDLYNAEESMENSEETTQNQ